jgi:HlyD family secretion protein
MRNWRRWTLWGVVVAAMAAAVIYAFLPQPIPVDVAAVGRGHLAITVDEEGETRAKDTYVVSAPIMGNMRRITLEVGDKVATDETDIAYIEPVDPAFMDVRTRAQAEAAVRVAEAAQALAAAQLKSAEADFEFAKTVLERARELYARAVGSKRALDEAERAHKTREAAVSTAKANLELRRYELKRAELQLVPPGEETRRQFGPCACVTVKSPVSGDVLRIFRKSAGVVAAAEQLVEIGDPRKLEIVVDLLSADAVKVRPGQRVIIDSWGGTEPLTGRVTRIEPFGKTKVSALGIEEQRVNVVIDFVDPPARWEKLGHGYRIEARIVLWEADNVLKLPASALYRVGDRWAVFVIENGRAHRRFVSIGRRNGLEAEITGGLNEGDKVIAYPSDRISDSVRVAQRQ